MKEPIRWSSFPSWRQFAWLYLMAVLVGWRAWLFWRFGVPGWKWWLVGAIALIATAGLLRWWARYELTPTRLVVRNGYTGREIGAIPLTEVESVRLREGPFASTLGIGTLIITSGERQLRFRGVDDPETLKQRIEWTVVAAATRTQDAAA